MGKALYREHRPRCLADVVGQEHITAALDKALKNQQVSHAYLFTGPRGVGKTSIARILAHEVNGLPYEDESNHLDIIEIDAASNRRIDEVRDLREKVHTAPTNAKYKVYIIDEVHMLTKEAFNALLKTLEEPPAHVIFILATTELHKLPETIISRTQHFSFRPIAERKVIDHLRSIAKHEKVKIDDEALKLLAEHGEGSFRDSISMLDQIRAYGEVKITVADVEQMLGIAPKQSIESLVAALIAHDVKKLLDLLQALTEQGTEAAVLAKQISTSIRTKLLEGSWQQKTEALRLLERLIQVPASVNPKAYLEVILLDSIFNTSDATPLKPSEPKSTPTQTKAEDKNPAQKKTEPKTPPVNNEKESSVGKAKESRIIKEENTPMESVLDEALWPQVLGHIKTKYNTLYGVLRMAQPQFDGDTVTLTFKFAFHQKRINDVKNKKIITDTIEKLCGASIKLVCTVGEPKQQATPSNSMIAKGNEELPKVGKDLSTISNIFGGAELLES